MLAELAGRFSAHQQKEEQINRDDREVSQESEYIEDSAESRAERRNGVGKQRVALRRDAIDDLANARVGELLLDECDPVRIVRLHIVPRVLPQRGQIADEIDQLGNHRWQ